MTAIKVRLSDYLAVNSIALFLLMILSSLGAVAQNVGIGISSPGVKLHVRYGISGYNSSYLPGMVLEGNNNTYLNFLAPDANETALIFGKASDLTSGGIVYNNSGNPNGLQFRTNGNTNRMVITNSGNVGIGHLNPIAPLSFLSSIGEKITFYGDGVPNYGIGVQSYLLQIHTDASASDIAFGYGSSGAFTETARIKGNGDVQANSYKYKTPRTYYYSISPVAFAAYHSTTAHLKWPAGVMVSSGQNDYLYAPVNLPHGATITQFTVYFEDHSTQDISVTLQYFPRTGGLITDIAKITTSGSPGNSSLTTNPINNTYTVNNILESYSILVQVPLGGAWPADFQLILKGVLITYTLTEAQ